MNKAGNTFYDERMANSSPIGLPISPRDPVMCKVQKTMAEAGELLHEVILWADKLCGSMPEAPQADAEKYINGFFDGLSNDASQLMRRVDEARSALARIRREFP
jgi:hypothetical protein